MILCCNGVHFMQSATVLYQPKTKQNAVHTNYESCKMI